MIKLYKKLVGQTNLVVDLSEKVELEVFQSLFSEKHLQEDRSW